MIELILNDLLTKYSKLYYEWRLVNPGYIGCNYGIKEMSLKNMIKDKFFTEELLKAEQVRVESRIEALDATRTMHGFYQYRALINEIFEEVNKRK